MLKRDYILLFMIFCYLTPILTVYLYYNSNSSVSNIICNDECRYLVLFFMLLMGIGALLYENERNDKISTILIFLLLIGIYGLISINEANKIHYIFTFLVFITIILFMIRHLFMNRSDKLMIGSVLVSRNFPNLLLFSSFLLEVMVLIFIIININKNIFFGEILYILNFAFFIYICIFFLVIRIIDKYLMDMENQTKHKRKEKSK